MKFGNLQGKKKYGKDYILSDFRPNILTDFLFSRLLFTKVLYKSKNMKLLF